MAGCKVCAHNIPLLECGFTTSVTVQYYVYLLLVLRGGERGGGGGSTQERYIIGLVGRLGQ